MTRSAILSAFYSRTADVFITLLDMKKAHLSLISFHTEDCGIVLFFGAFVGFWALALGCGLSGCPLGFGLRRLGGFFFRVPAPAVAGAMDRTEMDCSGRRSTGRLHCR